MEAEKMMVWNAVIDLYLDWAYGRNETVSMSNIIEMCEICGFDYEEIVRVGDLTAKDLKLN